MPVLKVRKIKVISNLWGIWKEAEKNNNARISMDKISADTDISKMTVRKLLEPNVDISGSPVIGVAVLAEYFGVELCDAISIIRETTDDAA